MVSKKPLPAVFEVTIGVLEEFIVELQVVPAIGVVASRLTEISLLRVTAVVEAPTVVAPAATTKCPAAALPKAAGLELEVPTVAVKY